ncbi:hypothetical protein LINGRAHAP2_LOCUS8134 [Linum grandiflorum]
MEAVRSVRMNSVMIMMLVVMGMMVGQSNANFQQCLVRCVRTCFISFSCIGKCGANCLNTDPPTANDINNTNNNKLCSLGCLAITLAHDSPAVVEAMEVGAFKEVVAENLVHRCSRTCNQNDN